MVFTDYVFAGIAAFFGLILLATIIFDLVEELNSGKK